MSTVKNANKAHFWACLDQYKAALATGTDIVPASLLVHQALGMDGVPKRWRRLVSDAFNNTRAKLAARAKEFRAMPTKANKKAPFWLTGSEVL